MASFQLDYIYQNYFLIKVLGIRTSIICAGYTHVPHTSSTPTGEEREKTITIGRYVEPCLRSCLEMKAWVLSAERNPIMAAVGGMPRHKVQMSKPCRFHLIQEVSSGRTTLKQCRGCPGEGPGQGSVTEEGILRRRGCSTVKAARRQGSGRDH